MGNNVRGILNKAWLNCPLGEYVSVVGGYAFKSELYNKIGVPVIRISNLTDDYVDISNCVRISQKDVGKGEKYKLFAGDTLMAMSGATTGKLGFVPDAFDETWLLNQRVGVFRIKDSTKVFSKYLRKLLSSNYFQNKLWKFAWGAAQPNISGSQIESIYIPLPPLAEQKRIAGILDTADALRAKRRESLAQLDTLLQSTFLDMFGDPVTNPKGWDTEIFDEWLSSIDSGWSPKCLDRKANEDEWGVLKLSAVTWCEFNENEQKALPADQRPRKEIEIQSGDLLFTRKNTYELVAAVAYVHQTRPKLMLSDLIFRLRIKPDVEVDQMFLWHLLKQPHQRQKIQELAGGAAGSMPNISKTKLKTIHLIKPPITLQRRFAIFVEKVEKQKSRLRVHLAELDTLFASLQSRAFNGEL